MVRSSAAVLFSVFFSFALTAFAMEHHANQASDDFYPDWLSPSSYFYCPEAIADPFVPFIRPRQQEQEVHKPQMPARPLTPLEKIAIEKLSLVGIIWTDGAHDPLAMVELPDGKGAILRKGSMVGPNQGKVVAIRPGEVVVSEKVANKFGLTEVKQTCLNFRPGQED